jgi:hypothetical protein
MFCSLILPQHEQSVLCKAEGETHKTYITAFIKTPLCKKKKKRNVDNRLSIPNAYM